MVSFAPVYKIKKLVSLFFILTPMLAKNLFPCYSCCLFFSFSGLLLISFDEMP